MIRKKGKRENFELQKRRRENKNKTIEKQNKR